MAVVETPIRFMAPSKIRLMMPLPRLMPPPRLRSVAQMHGLPLCRPHVWRHRCPNAALGDHGTPGVSYQHRDTPPLSPSDRVGGDDALPRTGQMQATHGQAPAAAVAHSKHPRVSTDDTDEQDDEPALSVEPRPPPPVPKDARLVVSAVLPGSVRDYIDEALSDSSSFTEDFYESQGDRRINVTPWKQHDSLPGRVRNLSFIAPVKGAFSSWGVPQTKCNQTHRMCLYQGDVLVFESSMSLLDIPYGDTFTVEVVYQVKPKPNCPEGPSTQMDLYVSVPFVKRTMFKKIIESNTFKQIQETYQAYVAQVQQRLQEHTMEPRHIEMPHPSRVESAELNRLASSGRVRDASQAAMQSPGSHRFDYSGVSRHMSRSGRMPSYQQQQQPHSMEYAAPYESRRHDLTTASGVVLALLGGLYQVMRAPFAGMLTTSDVLLRKGWADEQDGDAYPQQGGRVARSSPPWVATVVSLLCVMQVVMLAWLFLGSGHGAAQSSVVDKSDQYWLQRMQTLNVEVGLLHLRLESVGREIAAALEHLGPAASAALRNITDAR